MLISYKKVTILFIVISSCIRLLLANFLEFGNDEVYYWLYAKYPALSHFDHPPMVGFLIQLFTGNFFFENEVFIRLAAIIPASLSMYMIYLIGTYLKNSATGFLGVILYNLNFYGFIISGTFILPDSPMVLFWLVSFFLFLQSLPKNPDEHKNTIKLFFAFFFLGCSLYSKYQAVYLLFAVFLFVIFYNSKWLKSKTFYFGLLFPITGIFLIFYWNYSNDFISFKFHNNRVSIFSLNFNKDSFFREILGQIVYTNPYVFFVIVIALLKIRKRKFDFDSKNDAFFLLASIPLILTTIYLSVFKDTLPHWSGVSYLTLIPLGAAHLVNKENIEKKLLVFFTVLSVIFIVGLLVINLGLFIPKNTSLKIEEQGRKDVLMDLYGWKQASKKVNNILEKENLKHLPIVSKGWFPTSHIDYYIARPNKMNVYALGDLSEIHKYYWINTSRFDKDFKEALYITDSRNFINPKEILADFSLQKTIDTIPIIRGKDTVKYVFIYLIKKD